MFGLLDPRRILDPRGVRWREVDWHVLLVALVLVAAGLVFQSAMAAAEPSGVSGGVDYAGHREKLLVTAPLLLLALVVRPAWLRSAAPWLFAGCLVLLVAVRFVGVERNNARRWRRRAATGRAKRAGGRQRHIHRWPVASQGTSTPRRWSCRAGPGEPAT